MSENKNSRIAIILLLLLLLFVSGWFFMTHKSNTQSITDLTAEKEGLAADLTELVEQYNALLADKDSLNEELIRERDRILLLIDSVKVLQTDVEALRRYRNEVYKLKKENKLLLERADSLVVENKKLYAEKLQVEKQLGEEQMKNEVLTEEKRNLEDKVEQGSKLTAYEIISGAVRTSGDKEKSTDKVKRANKIKTCFVLSKNNIAKKGAKDIYVRLVDPEGMLIGKTMEEMAIEVGGEKIVCSEKTTIFYENQMMDICVYTDLDGKDIKPGLYSVSIYCEGELIGETKFELRKSWF